MDLASGIQALFNNLGWIFLGLVAIAGVYYLLKLYKWNEARIKAKKEEQVVAPAGVKQ